MKRKLLDLLCCPVDRADLELNETKSNGEIIIEGTLRCIKCGKVYPIKGEIPVLIPSI